MKTPLIKSPFNLMQERYRENPWSLLVGCIMFNMVQGKRAQPIHEEFLKRWGYMDEFFRDFDVRPAAILDLTELVRPLGFQNKRAYAIWNMSCDFYNSRPDLNDDVDVKRMSGIGKYGADSFNMFFRGQLVEDVEDKELKRYVEWAKNLNLSK